MTGSVEGTSLQWKLLRNPRWGHTIRPHASAIGFGLELCLNIDACPGINTETKLENTHVPYLSRAESVLIKNSYIEALNTRLRLIGDFAEDSAASLRDV